MRLDRFGDELRAVFSLLEHGDDDDVVVDGDNSEVLSVDDDTSSALEVFVNS